MLSSRVNGDLATDIHHAISYYSLGIWPGMDWTQKSVSFDLRNPVALICGFYPIAEGALSVEMYFNADEAEDEAMICNW